jgi:hypothetical protein
MFGRVNNSLTVAAATQVLVTAMDDINGQRRKAERREATPATILVGPGAVLDSLLLLNFLVAAEQRLAENHGVHVSLVDLVADLDEDQTPLESIATLARHLAEP